MKAEKFTGPNKVLLVLGQRTGAHWEDCRDRSTMYNYVIIVCDSFA